MIWESPSLANTEWPVYPLTHVSATYIQDFPATPKYVDEKNDSAYYNITNRTNSLTPIKRIQNKLVQAKGPT
jgi:hypothetical protein